MPEQCHTQNHQKAQMILETTNETIGYMLIYIYYVIFGSSFTSLRNDSCKYNMQIITILPISEVYSLHIHISLQTREKFEL